MKNRLSRIYYYIAIELLNPWIIFYLRLILSLTFSYCSYGYDLKTTLIYVLDIIMLLKPEELFVIEDINYLKQICYENIMVYMNNKIYLKNPNEIFRKTLTNYLEYWADKDILQKYIDSYDWSSFKKENYTSRTHEEYTKIINEVFISYVNDCIDKTNQKILEMKQNVKPVLLEYANAIAGTAYRASKIATPEYIDQVIAKFPWLDMLNKDNFEKDYYSYLQVYYLQEKLNVKYDWLDALKYDMVQAIKVNLNQGITISLNKIYGIIHLLPWLIPVSILIIEVTSVNNQVEIWGIVGEIITDSFKEYEQQRLEAFIKDQYDRMKINIERDDEGLWLQITIFIKIPLLKWKWFL